MHIQNMILKGRGILNEMLTSIKGLNYITNLQKLMCNNQNLDLVIINAFIKFGEILSICYQGIERKYTYERWNDGLTD